MLDKSSLLQILPKLKIFIKIGLIFLAITHYFVHGKFGINLTKLAAMATSRDKLKNGGLFHYLHLKKTLVCEKSVKISPVEAEIIALQQIIKNNKKINTGQTYSHFGKHTDREKINIIVYFSKIT